MKQVHVKPCFVVLFYVLYGILCPTYAQNENSVSGDRQALMDLYEATGGSGWSDDSGWGSGDPSNSWHGVEVNSNGRVVRLDLRDNNLSGQLPESIGNLQQLRYLNLKQNRLTGPIPASIGNWSKIEFLYLAGRTGEDLHEMHPNAGYHPGKSSGSGNDFEGQFPDVWAGFTTLKYFQLSGSSLTEIFYESIGEATELRYLVAAWNKQVNDTLPASLSNNSKLQWIIISESPFTGQIPSMRNLRDLRTFWANDSALSGRLPSFENCTKLRNLNLSKQRLNGGGLTGSWDDHHYWNNGQFTNLIAIRASHNYLSGTLHEFDNLDLKVFNLDAQASSKNADAGITGQIPASITSMDRLKILGLGWNKLTGQIPQNGWGNHNDTRYIRLQDNNLEGPIPDELPNSSDLQYLYFQGNELSGEFSTNHGKYDDSGDYPYFNYIDISDNNFSPSDYEALLNILGSSKLRY